MSGHWDVSLYDDFCDEIPSLRSGSPWAAETSDREKGPYYELTCGRLSSCTGPYNPYRLPQPDRGASRREGDVPSRFPIPRKVRVEEIARISREREGRGGEGGEGDGGGKGEGDDDDDVTVVEAGLDLEIADPRLRAGPSSEAGAGPCLFLERRFSVWGRPAVGLLVAFVLVGLLAVAVSAVGGFPRSADGWGRPLVGPRRDGRREEEEGDDDAEEKTNAESGGWRGEEEGAGAAGRKRKRDRTDNKVYDRGRREACAEEYVVGRRLNAFLRQIDVDLTQHMSSAPVQAWEEVILFSRAYMKLGVRVVDLLESVVDESATVRVAVREGMFDSSNAPATEDLAMSRAPSRPRWEDAYGNAMEDKLKAEILRRVSETVGSSVLYGCCCSVGEGPVRCDADGGGWLSSLSPSSPLAPAAGDTEPGSLACEVRTLPATPTPFVAGGEEATQAMFAHVYVMKDDYERVLEDARCLIHFISKVSR
jgi:hypothetical protein